MTLSKTEKLARQRANFPSKKLVLKRLKTGRNSFFRPLTPTHAQAYQLQLILFRANQKDGWLHERNEETVISERPREMADRAYELNDDYY